MKKLLSNAQQLLNKCSTILSNFSSTRNFLIKIKSNICINIMSTKQQPDETLAADITQQVTSPTPTIRPAKNPKRVAAGKLIAERTWAACEAQKKAAAEAAVVIENNKAKQTEKAPAAPSPATEGNTISSSSLSSLSSLSTTQWLTVVSIVASLVGIYYKREELKAFYNKKVAPQHAPQQPAPVEPEPEPATVFEPRKGGLKK